MDLLGQLSNPLSTLLPLVRVGFLDTGVGQNGDSEGLGGASPPPLEETGRLSNPVGQTALRRLGTEQIDHLVEQYQAGRSLRELAVGFGIHRRTVADHLERRGVARRPNQPKLTTKEIGEAARQYEAGASLAVVGEAFGVDAATIRRALHRAGVKIRPRRGWS